MDLRVHAVAQGLIYQLMPFDPGQAAKRWADHRGLKMDAILTHDHRLGLRYNPFDQMLYIFWPHNKPEP